MAAVLLPIVIGLIWGVTNPFIAKGTRKAAACPVHERTGVAWCFCDITRIISLWN